MGNLAVCIVGRKKNMMFLVFLAVFFCKMTAAERPTIGDWVRLGTGYSDELDNQAVRIVTDDKSSYPYEVELNCEKVNSWFTEADFTLIESEPCDGCGGTCPGATKWDYEEFRNWC